MEHKKDKNNSGEKFITLDELAKILKVVPMTIYRKCWAGKLPHYRMDGGRKYLFLKSEVMAALKQKVKQ